MVQTTLDFDEAKLRRDAAISRAVNHANSNNPRWQELALDFLLREIIGGRHQFRIEEIREAAERFGRVPEPPSRRAWGHVAVIASKKGWIRKVGYSITTNPKAHATPATLWESLL